MKNTKRDSRIKNWLNEPGISESERATRAAIHDAVTKGGEAANRDSTHARQHLSYVVVNAAKKLDLLVNNFEPSVWDDDSIINGIDHFLDERGTIRAVVAADDFSWATLCNRKIFKSLMHWGHTGRFTIKRRSDVDSENKINLAIADNVVVRFEKNFAEFEAVTFRDRNHTCSATFDPMYERSTEFPDRPPARKSVELEVLNREGQLTVFDSVNGLRLDVRSLKHASELKRVAAHASLLESYRIGAKVSYQAAASEHSILLTLQ